MPAQRHHSGSGTSDVAEQELQERAAADDLHSVRVLRPRHGIRERRRAIGAGIHEDRLGHLEEDVPGTAGAFLDDLRRVAAEVVLDDLEDGAWILKTLVADDRRLDQRRHQLVEGRT